MSVIKDRKGHYLTTNESQEVTLGILYKTVPGRMLLKVLTKPALSRVVGCFLDSFLSTGIINIFLRKSNIKLSDYEKRRYRSYNEFFTRKIRKEKRPISKDPKVFISPCDSKFSVYEIDGRNVFHIKGSAYTLRDLLDGDEVYKEYEGGYCMIFRLTIDDYHRYCYIDDGVKGDNYFIPGELHTVNPIALEHCNIYKRNCREYTVLETKNFDKVVQVEVGAMMIGRIINHHGKHAFKRGEEKGMFEFGGSTTVLLVKKGQIQVDEDLLENSKENIETIVKLGERIGYSIK